MRGSLNTQAIMTSCFYDSIDLIMCSVYIYGYTVYYYFIHIRHYISTLSIDSISDQREAQREAHIVHPQFEKGFSNFVGMKLEILFPFSAWRES